MEKREPWLDPFVLGCFFIGTLRIAAIEPLIDGFLAKAPMPPNFLTGYLPLTDELVQGRLGDFEVDGEIVYGHDIVRFGQ